MDKFIPKEKMSKKAQRELNRKRRTFWTICPATKRIDNKKAYSRRENAKLCRTAAD